jgi:hypothetical protein
VSLLVKSRVNHIANMNEYETSSKSHWDFATAEAEAIPKGRSCLGAGWEPQAGRASTLTRGAGSGNSLTPELQRVKPVT